jgi:hypothetical protein
MAVPAQAVLELNRADRGNRRFICVQLPEPTNHKRFRTIAEIGKERIRRAIAKIMHDPVQSLPLNGQEFKEDLQSSRIRSGAQLGKIRLWSRSNGDRPPQSGAVLTVPARCCHPHR